MPTRRTVLIGLGGLVAGGGALFATGAFTTVEAQRTVNVATAGDGSAFLQLVAARTGGEYVDDSGDGTIEINLDGTDAAADGLNRSAITTFDNLVTMTNNGTQDISSIEFDFDVTGTGDDTAHEAALAIRMDGQTFGDGSPGTGDISGDVTLAGGDANLLETGESVNFGIQVDLLNHGITDFEASAEVTLTITVDTA